VPKENIYKAIENLKCDFIWDELYACTNCGRRFFLASLGQNDNAQLFTVTEN